MQAASDLLPFIPASARVILEVEGGTDGVRAALLRRQPNVNWYGVDVDGQGSLGESRILAGVLPQDSLPRQLVLAPNSVDVLVLGQSLERTQDPARLLTGLMPLLRDGGVALLVLSHTAPASAPGQPAGSARQFPVLDRLRPVFRAADLTPISVKALPNSKDLFVLTAVRGPAPPRLHISQLVLAPKFMDVRTVEPGDLLETLPGVEVRTSFDGLEVKPIVDSDAHIILLHRLMPESLEAMQVSLARVIACGYLVVMDWDDHPGLFPGHLRQMAESWIGPLLTACHAVQTSTETLAALLREINPEVRVLGNHLSELPDAITRPESPVKLFFGAVNRETDWAPYAESLNRILAMRSDVQLVVVHDRQLFERMETKNKHFSPALPKDEYLAALHGCHIAWLPLADRIENRCKSDLKSVEAGAGAMAILAEETVYGNTLRHGETGWLYGDLAGFEAGLVSLLDDPVLRIRLGDQARAWVASQRMAAFHIESRREWYLHLWSRREELTSALFKRVPDLQQRVQSLRASERG